MDFSVGQSIGDYEILGILGAGGMGKVYQVRNKISQRIDAMKILLPDLTAEPDLVDRFLREIRISASLEHPNIAGLRTAQRVDNQLIMIMEFVEGQTLDSLMKLGKIPIAKGVDYMQQALSALSYAHARGVVHRDIKPANMMLTPSGVIKLMDFGIAKVATDQKLTKTGLMVGSVFYMSPEQIEGKDLDGRSDLYSLGITLYEMATGKRPFNGDSEYKIMAAHLKEVPPAPREIDASLPAGINDIIMLALAKDPAQRFQTADAFRNALAGLGAQTPGLKAAAVPPPITPPAAVSAKRNNRLWYMLAGSAATVAVIAAAIVELPKFLHTGAASKPQLVQQVIVQPAATQEQQPAATQEQPPASNPVTPPPQETVAVSNPGVTPPRPVTQPVVHATPQRPARQLPQVAQQQPVVAHQEVQQQSQQQQPVPQPNTPPPAQAPPGPSQAVLAQVEQLREHAGLMSVRVSTIRVAFQNLQRQQAASGLSPRSDMVAADQRVALYFEQAENSLRQNDPAGAKRNLDLAERELEKLESFLGK